MKPPTSGSAGARELVITVTANFTAEPLAETLRFWLARLDLEPARLEFSAYNQIFQELMTPTSVLASGAPGVNFLAIRFEDLARAQAESLRAETIATGAREFLDTLGRFAEGARRPTIVALCPPSAMALADGQLSQALQAAETEVQRGLAGLRGVSVVTARDVAALYPVDTVDDPESDRQGHIPFSPPYWVALGTALMRKARPLLHPPHKVLALDADNTLWGGVVGESGPDQVEVAGEWRRLQESLISLKQQGLLLALVSKNREEDVAEVFSRPDMVLRREDFVAWKVNWDSKAHNIAALAHDLELGLDSVIFLDDNPMECAEVAARCPWVTVLELPPRVEDIPAFLRHVWAFDLPPATAADRSRTEQYRQQTQRKQLQADTGSLREFLEKLDLTIEVAAPSPEQFDRAAQLTQRTNQFNTTGVRRTTPELASLLTSGDGQALLVRVRDRFGDYGDVGLCVYWPQDDGLYVDNFLLSCRVLGKGVEHRMLAILGRLALQCGKTRVIVPLRRTARNEPAVRFLEGVGRAYRQGDLYLFPAAEASRLVFDPDDVSGALPEVSDDPAAAPGAQAVRCDFGEIARRLAAVPDITLAVRQNFSNRRPDLGTPLVGPRHPMERTLAAIWADVLGLDRVGIHDNFFELGGDSVLSIQAIAKAAQAGLRYTLRQQFEHPTIAALASLIDAVETGPSGAEQGVVTGTAPLTPIQRWFFEKDLPDPQHWNMALLLEARQPLAPALMEEAVRHLLLHHDALRLRFRRDEDGWEQSNDKDEAHPVFSGHDLSALGAEAQETAMQQAASAAQASLDLAQGPLVRALWFDLGPARPGRLLIIIHHLVVDGITWRVLLDDFQTVYRQLADGRPPRLPMKSTSYLQWATRLGEYAESGALAEDLEYWRDGVGASAPALPADSPDGREAALEATARVATTALTSDDTRSLLLEVPTVYHTQINDILLTALLLTLHRWTGQRSLRLDLEGHGREALFPDLDLSRTAGWFTSIYPVRLQLDQPEDLGHSLRAVKEQLRRIPNRGVGYSILRYLHPDATVRDSLRRLPPAPLLFNYLGQFDQTLPATGLFRILPELPFGGPLRGPRGRQSHLLEIIGRVTDGQLRLEWIYSDRVFAGPTIDALARWLGEALRDLIQHCLAAEAPRATPADFPLAKLGQQSLDQLMARLARK